MRLVLDTNVWLDWLLFADPRVARLRAAVEAKRAEVVIDAACEAEVERVLGYRFAQKWPVDKGAIMGRCRAIALEAQKTNVADRPLPRCADPDDQKFLELALAAGADCLLTRDEALLRLAARAPFRILRPEELPLE